MQENEFEKRVQNRLAGLSLVPNEEVWKQVEARIRKEKRRRLIFYWLLAGLFLTGGIGTLIFLNHNNTSPLLNISSVKKPANDQKISDELLVKKPAITKKDEIFAEKKDAQKRIAKVPKETLQSSASARKTKVSDPGKTTLFRETPDENSELPKAKQKELILSKKENEILEAAKSIALNGLKNVPGSKLESKTELPPHKYYLSNINQKIASEALQKSVPPTEDKTSIKDTTGFLKNDNAIKEKNVKNILRKWKYGFTIYAGVSDNVTGSGSGLASPRTLADINSSLSQGPSAAATNIPPLSKLQYTSALSFGVG
ncbi:MAG: hypothetical protein H0X70_00800, partial [Segetibacter sp.]|nr:hypothetical protein [Segetibacter sp.]